MKHSFWNDRWQTDRIGFHLEDVNPNLTAFAGRLPAPREDACVLVPLCGKAHDLVYLARAGHRVVGVEFIEKAVREFFKLNDFLVHENPAGRFDGIGSALAERITLWRRDYFEMAPADLPPVSAVYDRAALIALPADLRTAYVRHTTGLAAPDSTQLLVTLDYDQTEMGGPPHAVSPGEVESLYAADWEIEPLQSKDILAESPRFADQGMTRLEEATWLLRRRA